MRVLPVRRRQEFGEPTLNDVIAQSDYVVMSTPLTPGTRGLLSRERIAAMKPTAVFINLGRGATVGANAVVTRDVPSHCTVVGSNRILGPEPPAVAAQRLAEPKSVVNM